MGDLTPEQRYRQANQLCQMRITRNIRLWRAGKIGFLPGGDGGRAEIIREIGRAYEAGFAAGRSAIPPATTPTPSHGLSTGRGES